MTKWIKYMFIETTLSCTDNVKCFKHICDSVYSSLYPIDNKKQTLYTSYGKKFANNFEAKP